MLVKIYDKINILIENGIYQGDMKPENIVLTKK